MTVEEFNRIHAPGATAEETPEGIEIRYFGSPIQAPVVVLTKKGFIYTREAALTTPMLNHITEMNNLLQSRQKK